jgi:trehalose 6-phosphate synthase/phosphatase
LYEVKIIKQLFAHVSSNTAYFWAKSFVKELRKGAEFDQPDTILLDSKLVINAYKETKKRLVLLDYDGTLTPIKKTPGDAIPSTQLLDSLDCICRDPKNQVYVISGRDQKTLDEWLGHIPNLGLSAE